MEIKQIKDRLNIERVLNHYGLIPDRNGMIKCPFHADDTASMKIYSNTNTFNCFGCAKNGDVIEFCSLKEGSKHKGILKAQELIGEFKPNPNTTQLKNKDTQAPKDHHKIIEKIFTYFENGLKSGTAKHPVTYLESRGINPDAVELGYNSGQFHHRGRLSDKDMKACIDSGLLIPYAGNIPKAKGATYTPFAKDCIIFPLKNKIGNTVSIYGRRTTDETKNKHYYLKDRVGLYPGYPNPNTKRLILTEAIIDAATLLQIQEITSDYEILSCYGTNGLTEEHIKAINDLQNLEEIIYFFDGDKVAHEALQKHCKQLGGILPHVHQSIVKTLEDEDINSLYVAYDKEILLDLIENRKLYVLAKSRGSTANQHEEPLQETQETKVELPAETKAELPVVSAAELNTKNPEFIVFKSGRLQIIILGGINLQQLDRLRMTIKLSRNDSNNPLHSVRHTLDLYHADYLEKFIVKASEQLEISSGIIRRTMAELTDQLEEYRIKKIESRKEKKPQKRELSDQRYRKAVNYLKAAKLMERTNRDIGTSGMIGETDNRLLMYLVFTSRLREHPLHIISLGASGTGKTYLQEKISELIPEQDKLEITILSENAFYYFDRKELKNKLVLIEDMDGAENVLYPLRELQSKQRISKTIPIKDSKGNLKTITLQVEGPICLAGTTTRERLYEDNANRSLLIYLDGSSDHKEQIMEYQRKLSAGKVKSQQEKQLKEFFKDMQTILRQVKVRNPYAEYLKLPDYIFKPLRTNSHYLAVIETITFYHQFQREIKIDSQTGQSYIETTIEDIEWANRLLKDVLLAKADELPRAVRMFFERLKGWLKKNQKESFYAKEIREVFRMTSSSCNRYILNLLRNNYIKITGGNKYRQGYEYQIIKTEEYKDLQDHVLTALDQILIDLKSEVSRIPNVSQGDDGILNGKRINSLDRVSQ